jgi:DNA adenine methylase
VTPRRPLLRYHGGKWLLAPWIISHFPPDHRIYVEPFGGAASVLLRKPRVYAEIYNDLEGEIVNLFRVLQRSSDAAELIRLLTVTPFARAEFELSYSPSEDPVEQAQRTIIRAFMGFGSNSVNSKTAAQVGFRCMGLVHERKPTTGFRASSNRSGTVPAHDWAHYPAALEAIVERLRGVTIEHRDARQCMAQHDSPDTLHYCDPPYPKSTRADRADDYRHEMTDADHEDLAAFLRGLKGMVIVSGYDCPLYLRLYAGWQRSSRNALADGARARVETLWLSPNIDMGRLIPEEATP